MTECFYCGKEFLSDSAAQMYCCTTHRKAAQKRRRKNPDWVPRQCPTPFKAQFSTELDAMQRAADIFIASSDILYEYECPGCKKYHLTSNPPKEGKDNG